MGIAKSDDRRPWTSREKEVLAELMPQYCVRVIAKKMHRSINSIAVMSNRLQLSRLKRNGWFTKREVCEILAHDHKWVQARIDSGALEASSHYGGRPSREGMSAWHIKEEDLIRFIRAHPQDLVGCNIDIIMIVELLAGIINKDH